MYIRTAEMWYRVPTCSHPASPAVNVLHLNIWDICQNQEPDMSTKLLLKNRLCTFMVFSTHALSLCQDPKQDATQRLDVTSPIHPGSSLCLVTSSLLERTDQVSVERPSILTGQMMSSHSLNEVTASLLGNMTSTGLTNHRSG